MVDLGNVAELFFVFLLDDADVVVSPPFVYIDQVKNSLTDQIEISAQNSWVGKGGAFTGEIRSLFYLKLYTNELDLSNTYR